MQHTAIPRRRAGRARETAWRRRRIGRWQAGASKWGAHRGGEKGRATKGDVKREIELGGKTHTVEWTAAAGRTQWTIDGRAVDADAVEVGNGVYSILIGGESLEARVEKTPGPSGRLRAFVSGREYALVVRDPRRWRKLRGAAAEAEGAQQVLAPMPGKIVRVLVAAGDAVSAGQGIAVVEAMKMQNEVRAPKSGKVARLHVREGQTMSAGEAIAVVE